ncbi:MAG: FAD-dependent oxidoreductase [Gammaproteobacteria bacterium]|nr:FAD-dependent oxidoreductase [Gammaproteobacteria bacterium]
MTSTDALVIGGGIAGASIAYALSEHMDVLLVEQESTLAYHTTGRSAAQYFENYGAQGARSLTKASRSFLEHPPEGLVDWPLMTPRGALIVGREDQRDAINAAAELGNATNSQIRLVGAEEVVAMVPVLRSPHAVAGVWEPGAAELDVAALHQAFIRGARRNGSQIRTSAPATRFTRQSGQWVVTVGDEEVRARFIMNAAGAWGDVVATRAGVRPIGLTAHRRTVFMASGVEGSRLWPLVVNVGDEYYFKPDGEQILCSLSDESPSEPCDARPVDLDIALAIERINEATTLNIRSVRSSWAGLRTFADDREMVIGFDPDVEGFFWYVGQGGTGIQTSPAAATLAAGLIVEGAVPKRLLEFGVDASVMNPGRLRR